MGDVANTLYRLVQFAIREAVATRTLDEILAARDTIDREVRTFVRERAADTRRGDRRDRRQGRDPAGRRARAAEQGGGGGADGQGQPDPPPGGDGGDAVAAQHGAADGGQPSAAAAQGARGRWSSWSRRSAASTCTRATEPVASTLCCRTSTACASGRTGRSQLELSTEEGCPRASPPRGPHACKSSFS